MEAVRDIERLEASAHVQFSRNRIVLRPVALEHAMEPLLSIHRDDFARFIRAAAKLLSPAERAELRDDLIGRAPPNVRRLSAYIDVSEELFADEDREALAKLVGKAAAESLEARVRDGNIEA